MGILPGLFLFKQPSYLVNPLPPPTDHRRFIIKATRSATSEDSRKDSHGVSSRLPLLLFPTIATLPIEPMSAGEGESSTARTPRHRCVCIFRTIRSRLQGVRSVDHSHEKPLTSRYSERPFHAFQRTFSDPLTVRCVRFRLGVALRYVTLRYVLFPVATVDRRYREKKSFAGSARDDRGSAWRCFRGTAIRRVWSYGGLRSSPLSRNRKLMQRIAGTGYLTPGVICKCRGRLAPRRNEEENGRSPLSSFRSLSPSLCLFGSHYLAWLASPSVSFCLVSREPDQHP